MVPNVVLFIFQTKMAHKILLKIPTPFNINKEFLLEYVRNMSTISVPDNGSIVKLNKVEDLCVFIWEFEDYTVCSKATLSNFGWEPSQKILCGVPVSGGEISYPYYTLQLGKKLNERDEYPTPKFERMRLNMLSHSLQKNGFCVQHFGAGYFHYCEFSGGGDIYIENEVEEPLVFQLSQIKGNDDTFVAETGINVSPAYSGTQKLSALSVEGKRGRIDNLDDGVAQLWANMMVLSVERFLECCDQDFGKKFMKNDLINIQRIIGYGILCCGDGTTAGYKLEIIFNTGNFIVETIKPTSYNKTESARLMDNMLEYYSQKMEQLKSNHTE